MPKLHEILAAENGLSTQADTCRKDLANTFEKKPHHFTKKVVTLKSLVDGIPDKEESQLALQTTVTRELGWISAKLAKAMNAGFQIDQANTVASADVVLSDGTVLIKSVPVTALMRMEHRLDEVRALIHTIPTLDPAKGFALDTSEGDGIYRARDDARPRTEKKFDFVVMYPATDKHPAQVKELMADKQVGTVLTQEWSGLITVADKGDMLDRVEGLIQAVKAAKARANETPTPTDVDFGGTILKHVFGV